ncbi:MAG TPA: GNAT family N-acetyltransferase [Actinomadura sp.]|nr:GNAT family N-acetyltransferase [Actinomadura sp.]
MPDIVRDAREGDREMIRQWRNHPKVRQASHTTHEIDEREHARWWSGVEADPARLVLIYELDGIPCGVVTFEHDRTAAAALWGFYFDLEGLWQRGDMPRARAGLGPAALGHAFDALDLAVVRAEVLANNAGSLRLHREYGFVETGRRLREADAGAYEVVQVECVAAGFRSDPARPVRRVSDQ